MSKLSQKSNPTSMLVSFTGFLCILLFHHVKHVLSIKSDPSRELGQIFELDLYVNDINDGWQSTGFPYYLQTNATSYTNVAGISFIQPSDLMNTSYDLPRNVGKTINQLRKQNIIVQLLVGGEISTGWPELQSNPTLAANKAIELMKNYDIGIEIDNEYGGDINGTIESKTNFS